MGVTLLELLNHEKCKMKWKQRSSARSFSFQCSCRRHVAVDTDRWVHLGVEVVALKLILRLGVRVLGFRVLGFRVLGCGAPFETLGSPQTEHLHPQYHSSLAPNPL